MRVQREAKRRWRMARWAVLGLALGGGALGAWLWWTLAVPVGALGRVLVKVEAGWGASRVATELAGKGLIRSSEAFVLAALVTRKASRLQHGEYVLSGEMTPLRMLEAISRGQVESRWVTIPEGYRVEQVAEALQQQGLVEAKEFLALAKQRGARFETGFPPPGRSLEGYLFPDTYRIAVTATPEAIIEQMLSRFEEVAWRELCGGKPPADGRSLRQVVALASLVEAEAKRPQERALIAGVLMNRLRQGRRLECDATVQYALGAGRKSRLLYADLNVPSPYNTYLHAGLPPGPINSPGQASLQAALRPAGSPYLYYVARADGSHIFSRTLGEHADASRRARASWKQPKSRSR